MEKYQEIILLSGGLLSLFFGFCNTASLIKSLKKNGPFYFLLGLILFFIISYFAFLIYQIPLAVTATSQFISTIFLFGGIFVAVVTYLSKTTIQDIQHMEEIRLHNKSLSYLAEHDDLTGLLKASYFKKAAQTAIDLAKNSNSQSAILFIDFDKFKIINDTHGHDAGDKALKLASEIFVSTFRKQDMIARLGGDEFGVLLQDASLEGAITSAKNLIAKLNNTSLYYENIKIPLCVSIGIAGIDNQSASLEDVMKQADIACYTAKSTASHINCFGLNIT